MRNLLLTLRTTLLLFAVLISMPHVSAYDFEVDGIYYNKTGSNTVEVPALDDPGPDPDDPHMYGCWLVLLDKNSNEVWHELYLNADGSWTTTVYLDYDTYGTFYWDPNYSDAQNNAKRPNVPYHFVVDGQVWGAPEADQATLMGEAANTMSNPLYENVNNYTVPVGYAYVLGIYVDPSQDDQLQDGTWYYVYCAQGPSLGHPPYPWWYLWYFGNHVGDVNGDGKINIADLTTIISVILSGDIGDLYWESLDINDDGEINIADVNVLVDLIFDLWADVVDNPINCPDKLFIAETLMNAGETYKLDVILDHYDNYIALQCDIIMPEGLTLNQVKAASNNRYNCFYRKKNDKTTRVMLFGLNEERPIFDGGTVLTLNVRANEDINSNDITLKNIVVSDADLKAWYLMQGQGQGRKPILTVNFPSDANAVDYANMRLQLSSADGSNARHYSVSNKTSYRFSPLEGNTTWNVKLTNPYGDVFGDIENIHVGNEDVDVTFPPLPKPHDVSLTVKTPASEDVTGRCKISWLDENGELLLQGNPIKRLPPGRKLQYQVTLPQDLATAYALPATNTYTVIDGSNLITCQLTAISKATLSGSVKDASNNQPLYGATISAVQSFDEDLTKTVTARTDNQGHYSLEASSVHTSLTVAASGYISQTVDCDMTGGSTVTVTDVSLSPITGTVVNVNLTYTPAHLEGEPAQLQNWYSDYDNVDYEVFNKTTGRAMTGVHVQYPQLVLTEDVNDGDVLEITATSRKDAFNPVKATVTIAEQKATATFNILEKGKVSASFNKNINPQVVGSLYDANGKLVTSANYSGSALTLDNLVDGSYKLVTMGKSEFFNDIYDLEQFAVSGLQNGVDYAQSAVTVSSGLISPVSISEVPYFDETKFYYTGEGTSFSVNKPDIVVGNYLTFRAQVDFKEQYRDKVTDVQVIVDLPESCQFYEKSVMVGGSMGGYTIDGNRIIIPLSDDKALVRLCAIPTVPGDFNPSAFVQFRLNGKTITQPIGNANYKAKRLSINVPSTVAETTIPVSGTAIGVCEIDIFDNDILIGHTISRADGYWSTKCELNNPYNLSTHNIYANAITSKGIVLQTEVADCFYDKNAIEVDNVVMTFYNGWLEKNVSVKFDCLNGIVNPTSYQFYTATEITFVAEFTSNDTSLIKNVFINVFTDKGNVKQLPAVYDNNIGKWIATNHFESDELPINVSVDFVCNSPTVLDDNFLKDLLAWFDGFNDPISGIDENDLDVDSLTEYLDGLSDDELLEYIDELVNESLIWADDLDPTNNYIESDLDDGRHVVISIHNCDSISENECSNGDYERILKTTGNYLYLKYSDEQLTYVDFENNLCISIFYSNNSNNSFNAIDRDFIARVGGWINDFAGLIAAIDSENNFLKNWLIGLLESHKTDYSHNLLVYKRCTASEKIAAKRMVNAISPTWSEIWASKLNDIYDSKNNAGDAVRKVNGRINGLSKILGKLTAIVDISMNAKKGYDAMVEWQGILESIATADPNCPGLDELFDRAKSHTRWIRGAYIAAATADLASLKTLKSKIGGVVGLVLFNISIWSTVFADNMQVIWTNNIRNQIPSVKCLPEPKKPAKPSDPKTPPTTPVHDPSGFVYEGVPSNRLQGVTATCYYKETVEDMYGDEHENVVLWDAEQYGQQNPLLTDENGFYRWDVPIGMWQVKYEKEGYETAYSDWLPVPPPQLDVNIGMVQMRQPEVIKARAYPQAVELEFDKYMFPETLTTDNITVSVNGQAVSGTIELLNAEVDDPLAITSIRRAPGTGLTLASRVRFNADRPFNASEVTLHVKQDVKSYADLMMNGDYEAVLPIELEMQSIQADSTVNVIYGDSRELTVTVLPAAASKGKTLTVRSVAPMIATTDAEAYTLNSNGQAVITVHGDLPGMTSLVYTIDGYDLTASTLVKVMMESEMTVALPTASIASGSEVEKGTAVYLKCATPGATIYYTLDGSCPCDPSEGRKVWDGSPIVIDRTVTIKAMAVADGLYDSDVATFIYRVRGLKGDVNRDGAVNIADVNLLIDYILRDRVTSDMLERGDVNGDGAINIGDINAVIQIILGGSSARKPVNTADLLHAGDLTLQPGQTGTLTVTLDHASRYSAMQCDIELPQGLTLVGVTASGQVETSVTGENTARAVAYSMSRQPLATGDGQAVLTLTVHADAALASESRVALTGVVLADVQGTAWYAQGCTARVSNASGINDLQATGKQVARVRYYNVAGQEIPAPAGLTIQVTTYTDGTTVATRLMSH